MPSISINRITNVNVYLNGRSLLGRAEEIDLPEIKAVMAEHKALGMVGKVEFPAGFDKLEAKIKWNSFYPEVLLSAADPFRSVELQCRGSVDAYTSQGRTAELPLVVMMTAAFKKFSLGKFKQNDNAENETELAVYYVKQMLDGVDIVEFDVLANIFKVGGVDRLAAYRINIGG